MSALLLVFVSLFSLPDDCRLSATLSMPQAIDRAAPLEAQITIRNEGEGSCRFVRYWKWATNRMFFESVGPQNKLFVSEALLVDIDRKRDCFFVKGLGAGDSYTFRVVVNGEAGTVHIPWPGKGSYKVSWKYAGDEASADICRIPEIPTWTKDLVSNQVEVVVK